MPIAEADWRALDKALDQLLELDAAQRERELQRIEVQDQEQARTLRRLLRSLDEVDPIAGLAESTLFAEALSSAVNLAPGTQINDWQIGRRLGSGGMAEVYQAEREIGEIRQCAALKIMALGVGGEQAQARFRQETGILARLDDPRLSRLIDAGRLADGRPWLAMEYVDGAAIDAACDQRQLSLTERVRLIIQIAQALDHAHRLLVIHRDLKPANILLDSAGRPRILDFGIAKLVDPLDGDGDRTSTVWQAYTLRFASPEQLTGAPTGVASDVFQLGLLLYLLLTGRRPYAGSDDQPLQLLQAIRSGCPLPSRQWTASDRLLASARGATPARLRKQIAGDLDSIVLRALEAEPEHRYRGARELADDLQRWLDGAAVQARSASPLYRAARWLRRYRLGVGAVALLLTLITGYALMAVSQRNQLEMERNRTQAVLESLTQMFSAADPYADNADTITVSEVVRATAERLMASEATDPQVQAALLERLAMLAESARDGERQIKLLQAARQLVLEHQLDGEWAARLMLNVAQAQAASGLFNEAQTSLDLAFPDLSDDDRYSGRLFAAQLQGEAGERESAAAALQQLLQELPQGPEHASRTANAHNSLALILGSQGKLAESAEHYRLALASAPREQPADQDLIGTIRSNLAVTLARQRRYAESEQEFRAVLQWRSQTLGSDHPSVANAASVFSPLLVRTLRFQSAWELLVRFRGTRAEGGTNGYRWPDYLVNLARAGIYSGHELDAVDATIAALSSLSTQVPNQHPRARRVRDYLAWWLFELGELDAARQLALQVDPSPDERQLHSPLILILLTVAESVADQRSALLQAVQADPCDSVELEVLRAALTGETDFDHLRLPSRCDGLQAARLQQLGVQWQPDWDLEVQAEAYSSPLAERLQGNRPAAERLSAEQRQAIEAVINDY